MKKKLLFNLLPLLILGVGPLGCSNAPEDQVMVGELNPSSSSPQRSNAGGPNVGNVTPPPPEQKIQGFKDYSPELKEIVKRNYNESFQKLSPDEIQGNRYAVTPLGNAISLKESSPPEGIPESGGSFSPLSLTGACSPTANFLCVDSPLNNDTVIDPAIPINGSIDICQSAMVNPNDLQTSITVIYLKDGSLIYQKAFKIADLSPTGPGCGAPTSPSYIGKFNVSPALDPAKKGKYKVTIDATQRGGPPKRIIEERTVIFEGEPQIAKGDGDWLLSPSENPGNLYNDGKPKLNQPVSEATPVSMEYVSVTIKLLTEGTASTSVFFENYSDPSRSPASLRYQTAGNPFVMGGSGITKTARLPLFEGENYFRVVAYNKRLKDAGRGTTTPSKVEFKLSNVALNKMAVHFFPVDFKEYFYPTCNVDQEGKLDCTKPPTYVDIKGQKAFIRFCFVNPPQLAGRPIPVSGGTPSCITDFDPANIQVLLNGRPVGTVMPAGTPGIFGFEAAPPDLQVGANFVRVDGSYSKITDKSDAIAATGFHQFGFGNVIPIVAGGALNETETSFVPNALRIDLSDTLVLQDVKRMIVNYISRDEFADQIKEILTSPGTPTNAECVVRGTLVKDDGKFTLTADSNLKIGRATLDTWDIQNGPDGIPRLHAGVTIDGIYGSAKIYTRPDKLRAIPIDMGVKQLKVNVALRFQTDFKTGLQNLVLEKRPGAGIEVVDITRDLAWDRWGQFIHTPDTFWSTEIDTLQNSFVNAIEANVTCFMGKKLSDPGTGLAKWRPDLFKMIGYDPENSLRFAQDFDLFGNKTGVAIALDVLKSGAIQLFNRGIQVMQVPLRIAPSSEAMMRVMGDPAYEVVRKQPGPVGSYYSPVEIKTKDGRPISIAPPYVRFTPDSNVYVNLNERLINQALFSMNLAGLLDFKINPGFFKANAIDLIDDATPQVYHILGNNLNYDFNKDGLVNEDDDHTAVEIRTTSNKVLAPHIHILDQLEKADLAKRVRTDPMKIKTLNTDLPYFRLTLSDLEVAVYALQTPQSGLKTFCRTENPSDDPDKASRIGVVPSFDADTAKAMPGKGGNACSQPISIFYESSSACPAGQTPFLVPTEAGSVISADNNPETPLVRFRVDLVLYGVVQGSFEEFLTADKFDSAGKPKGVPPLAKFLRVRILDEAEFGPQVVYSKAHVVQNNTSLKNDAIVERLNLLLAQVLKPRGAQDCGPLNEIRVRFDSWKYPGDKPPKPDDTLLSTLHDLGVDSFDLIGNNRNEWPKVQLAGGITDGFLSSYLKLNLHWLNEK